MRILLTPSGGRVALAPKRSYVLGRDSECDIVAHDLACSRQHAKITVSDDGKTVHVEDLGSSNGTWVNDEKIGRRTILRLGGRFRIGASVFALSLAKLPKNVSLMDAGTLVFDPTDEE